MDEVVKRRVIGAAVLIGAGVLIPIIVVKLAQPSAPPTGESVRVYEITPSGEARPVDADSKQTPSDTNAEPAVGQTSAAEAPPVAEAGPETGAGQTPTAAASQATPAPKIETEAPSQPEPAPKPKTEPISKPGPEPEPIAEPEPKQPPPAQPPVPAVTPPPPEATAQKPYFVIQVGSFGDESNAVGLTQELQRDFPVYYRAGQANGKQLYRVRVGPFDSREAADIVAARLRDRGLKTQTLSLP